jgi:hypothetical protein
MLWGVLAAMSAFWAVPVLLVGLWLGWPTIVLGCAAAVVVVGTAAGVVVLRLVGRRHR